MLLESLLIKEKAIYQLYAVMLPGSLGQSSSQRVKKTVKTCAAHRWVQISTCFREQWISSSQSQRSKGPSRLSLATEAKANICHGMREQQSKRHGWLAYVRKYYWHGGMYWNCTEIQYILPSRWYLSWEVYGYSIKTLPSLILHVLQ